MNRALLVSMFFIMILIIPIFSISAIEEEADIHQFHYDNTNSRIRDFPSRSWFKGADQIQINKSIGGMSQDAGREFAQSFRPTKPTLSAVALYFYKMGNPNEKTTFTISIREKLDGPDITNITILVKDFRIRTYPKGSWVLFDFPDIQLIPEKTYYIHKRVSHGGNWDNTYCWFIGYENPYSRGEPWMKDCAIFGWKTIWERTGFDPEWPRPDLCFITYYQEPKCKLYSHPILNYFYNHSNLFLQFLLNYIG